MLCPTFLVTLEPANQDSATGDAAVSSFPGPVYLGPGLLDLLDFGEKGRAQQPPFPTTISQTSTAGQSTSIRPTLRPYD